MDRMEVKSYTTNSSIILLFEICFAFIKNKIANIFRDKNIILKNKNQKNRSKIVIKFISKILKKNKFYM